MKKIVKIFLSALIAFAASSMVKVQADEVYTYEQLSICYGGNVTYNDRVYTQEGRDTIVLQSSTGGDSVIVLTISEYPTYLFGDTTYIKKGDALWWHGQTVDEAKTYYDIQQTIYGCDSIYYLVVYEKPSYDFYQDTTICFGETFEWHGQIVSQPTAGTFEYTASYASVLGTDSVYHLQVTIRPQYWTIRHLSFCAGESVIYNGKTYTKEGRDTLHLTNVNGCDSIIELIIQEYPTYHISQTVHIPEDSSYLWHGQLYNQTGTYLIQDKTIHGCDSTYTLTLIVDPKYEVYKDTVVCLGKSYDWNSLYIDAEKTGETDYQVMLQSVNGTDSIVHLHVTVLPDYWTIHQISLCAGESVDYKGKTYSHGGRDTLHYTSALGCDSIVEVIVTEVYPFHHYDTLRLEFGKSTIWRGQTISEGGSYVDEYQTLNGCDSIYELYVQLFHKDSLYQDTTICYGETFMWEGESFNQPGEYSREKVYKNVEGADSIMRLHLTILPKYWKLQDLFFCHGGSVTFNGKTYTQEGRDTIHFSSVSDCDSVVEIIVQEYPIYQFDQTVHIQKDSSYIWMGDIYTQTGTYTKTYSTVHGCDSIYVLNLIVDSAYTFYETATCCLGDIYEWQGLKISEATAGEYQYKVNYTSKAGTDSTYHLALTVRPKPWVQQVINLCPGEEVRVYGKTYSKAGKDTIVVPAETGCDSTIEVIINQYPSYHFRDTIHIPEDSSYLWHGQVYNQTGTYKIQEKTIYGCDSIYSLTLIVDCTVKTEQSLYFCHGGSVTYKDRTYTKQGRDTIVYQSQYGCDSLVILTINEYPSFVYYDTVYIAKGQTIEWHGLDISEAKTYEDAYRTVDGCDSIYYLVAYEKPSYQFYQDTTICFGEVFEWHNQKVSQKETGTYEYTAAYSSIWGTDSIYHLTVTILPEYWTIKQLFICDGMNVSFNGKTYTQSGRDTLYYTSALGCDSVVELVINAQTPLYFKDTIQLEEGTSLAWRGKTITDGGTYTDEYGCDSVFMLYVQMVHVDHFYQTVSICEGDVYTWEGKDYTLPGDYTASYKNMAGNDSIMHLHLMVNPKPWVIEYLTLCQGSTLEYNGKTYTHAGRDTITFTSSLGCDSIVEVIVREGYPFYHYDTIQLEAGKTTEWHGQTLSAGGSYTDEHKTTSGCDSIYEVYVQLYYVDHIYKDTTICYGETYTWQGETFSESGEYTREKVFKNVAGTDSIQHLHLIILPEYWTIKNLTICQGNSVTYNGKTYTAAGHDTIHFTSSHTCDSVVEVIVTEAYPFYQYDTIQLTAGTTIDWHGQTLSKGGEYEERYTTIAGCDSIYYLHVETVCVQTWTLQYLTLCQGGTVEYNGHSYSHAGRDTIHYTSSLGCDSVVEVIVAEVYPFHHYDTLQLEAGTTLEWRGQTIAEGGTYTDEYTTTSGCDSIYEVYVQVYYVDHIYKDTTICYGETYTWQGETFSESGEYIREKAFKNVAGTDSIMHLRLTILPKYWTVQNLTFCHDKSITFNGKTYTEPGRDTVYMTSSTGCDSIIELIINEAPIYAFYDTITIWDTETYEWVGHGQTITGSGEYKDEHISSGGCDSTYYLKVYVQHKDDIYETATICYGDSIVWQGNTYKEVGVHNYEVTYTNQYGNDSTMHLHLTVLPKYWQQQPLFFCHGTSVSYNGKTYNQEGKDTIYYNSINGCDSIVELIIKEYPTYLYQDTIHLQQGKELNWHGQTITQGGVYEDKQMSIYGCDSTYVLLVIEDKVYAFHEKANACVNQTFEWQGLQINEKEAGVYTYNVNYTTVQGADSTYYLELTVYPSYFEQKQFFICRGETLTFNNHVYSQPGRDTIRLISATGCDSLIEVIIDEYPSYNFNQTVHIKKDSSYIWNGKVLTQTGSYSQTFTTINGCDSTYTLTLIVDSAYTFHDTAVSCLGDVFEWQGLKISEAAAGQYNYKVNYSSQYGMDSTYYLSLTIRTKPWSQRMLYVCPGENVTFNNKNYSKAGRDTITLPAANGCDSVIEVVVIEYPSYRYNDTVHIKKDSVYTWRGQEYSQTGTYIVQDKSIYGCDSTYTLTLIVDSAYTFYEKADMCLGEIYEWHGLKISEDTAGVYTFTKPYTSIYGMDSVYHLTLEVHEIYKSQKQLFFCASDSVSFLGKVYSKEGKDTIHLQSIYGCDSIIEVLINEYPTYHFQETRVIKGDTSFVWQGKTITDAGVYDAHYSTINGCDSIYTLTVIKAINYEYWERAHICVGETFSWQGLEINEKATGTYEYRKAYVSQYNTDSIYHLTLTVDTSYVQYQYLSFCEGSYVTFGDSTYTTSGVDTLRYQAVGGCDSTIIVVITEQKRYFSSDTIELNNQQTFLWHGQMITQSGTYHDVRSTAAGCDSIYELVAIFRPTYLFEDSVAICKCEVPYIWKLNDTTEIELNHDAGLTRRYEQRYESIYHTDSIYRIILTVLPEYEQTIPLEICNDGSYYEFFGKHYSEPGTYTDTLKTIYGCDSIIHIQLNVLPQYIKVDTAYLSESHPTYTWSVNDSTFTEPTVYAINEKTIAGCDSINRLVLLQALRYEFPIEHDTLCSSGHDAIIWHNQTLTESGIYYDSLFTVLGEDSIYSIQLAVFPTYDTTISVTICEEDCPYLFNERVKCYETGTYTDTLQTIHGCDSVVRLELNVLPRTLEQVFDTICETDLVGGYFFHGAVYYNEGTYSRPLQTENQCNSVAELFLRLRPDLSESDSVVICAGETYVLGRAHDPAISEQYNGISVQPMKDTIIWGCDNIHYFRIIVRNEKDTTVNMCENDSLWLPGTKRWVFAEPNAVYIDTIKTDPLDRSLNPDSVHCDSIVRWTIGSIYPTYHPDTIVKHISDHDSILWAGQWRTATGIYVDSAKTVECGCDSFLVLKLIVDKTYLFRDSIHICQPHDVAYQHEWADGHIQSQAIWNEGVYVDSLRSSATADLYEFYHRDYKDSIYTLVVTMDPSYFFQQEYTLCQGDSVQLAGQWITKAGVYTDSLTTAKGCDSIYQYVVNMTQSYYYRENKSIAQGTIVKWHNRDLEIPGVYYDSLKTVTGCDSIYELTLNVYPIYHFITDTAICECQTPYLWHDQMIYESGTYFDKHQTIHHFDSIYELRIQVKDTSHVRFEAATCKGDSLFFDGQWLTQSGVYYDTIKNSFGCDSIIELVYIHKNSYLFEQTAQTDDQHPYIWSGHKDENGNDMVFTTSGFYEDKQKTYDGCDSIYQLTLTVYPTFRDTVVEHICNNDSLLWRGKYYYTAGIYTDALKTVAGYDSIFVLDLTVLSISETRVNASTCEGDSVFFDGRWITQEGTYYDTLVNVVGCDSIIEFVYTHKNMYLFEQTAQTDDQHPYIWTGHKDENGNDMVFTTSGFYEDKQKTYDGCDSIYQLTLTVYPTYRDTLKQHICSNDSLLWRNKYYYTTGIYTDALKTVAGYDSILVLDLTVLPISETRVNAYTCEGDSVFFDGRWISQEGTYYDTLVNVLGCDSIVEFVYTHKNMYLFEQTAQTDDQHPYIWTGHKDEEGNDMVFTASGLYQDKQKTIDGCDSIYQLTLTVYPTYRDTIREHICDDDSILWRGNYYKISGVYTDALKTVAGYDSIFVLDLTVVPISQVRINASTCEGDSVFFNEHWITEQGTYYDTLVNQFGCDSIIEFVYTHKNTYLFEQTAQTDDQHPYIWTGHKDEEGNDMTFTTSGLYQDKRTTIDGCDSIYRLSLTVYPTYRDTLKETICGNDRFFWRGNYYYTAGTYTDALKTVAGYDSIFVLELTVLPIRYGYREVEICQDDSVTINGQVIIANKLLIGEDSGTNLYYDTLSCDSVVITHLTILPKYFFVETRTISEDSLPFAWHGQSLEMAGTYYDYNKTVTGCDSTYELHLTVSKVADYTFEICQTELPYTLPSGKLINAAGIYPDTIRNSKGLDSLIYKYRVLVNPTLRGEMSVSICEGDFFFWKGDSLRVGGNYNDTVSSPVTGCDSIVTLHLFVKESYLTQINRTIYAGDSVIFEGDTLWHSGQYEKRYSTTDTAHCDSVIQLNLIVKPVYYRDTTVYTCESDLPYRWNRYNGEAFYSSGTYVRTHVEDSAKFVDTLHLFVDEPQNITIKTNICQGDTLYYRDTIYTTSGIFHDTILAASGCDTIITIVLNVYPISENHITVNISEDEKYSFGETIIDTIPMIVDGRDTFRLDTIHETRILYKPGTYYDYNKNIYGCDSITVLNLVVHKAKKDSINAEICRNELPYIFNGKALFNSGVYADSMYTKEGYDSVVVLNLTVNESYLIEESYTFEEGTTTRIHGVDISKDTIYYDTLRTIHGCDSVYKIIVNYPRLMEKTINAEACQEEGYEFHGQLFKNSGTYRYKEKDTLWTIHLTVHETQYTRLYHYLCKDELHDAEDSIYYYHGHKLIAPIIYEETFKSIHGCDSIVIFNLGITEHCSDWDEQPLCKGDSLIILGDTIRKPGEYRLTRKSYTGKNDSVYRVSFYEAPFYEQYMEATICQGDSLVFYGHKKAKGNRDSIIVKRAGKHDIMFKTVEGCDSIIHLDLTVNPSYSFVNKAVTVDYLPYTWVRDGKTYNVTGRYDYVLPTIHNCDSTFILDLEVIETQRPVQKEQICIGDTIMWRNKKYFATGIYTDTICDIPSRTSIIYSLDLTVVYPTRIDTAYIPVQEVCADAQELVVKLNWSGAKPQKYNISFDARARHEGFRDTMNAPFLSLDSTISIKIPEFNVPANAEHMRTVRPDKYTMSIILDNGICGQSKAENLQFLIRYPSWILEQRWENVVAVLAKDYNGGYEFSQYEWFVNGAPMPDKIPYIRYADYTFTAGDEVVAYLTRAGENYSVPTCPFVIQMPNPDTNPTPRLLITPTSSSLGNGAPRVMIKSEDTGHYTIYSMMGQPISQGQFRNGETTIDLPAIVGHYIVSATQDDGVHTAQKVMVY